MSGFPGFLRSRYGAAVQVAEGVHRLGHELVNWYAVVDGGSVTLIDTGLPADASQIEAELVRIGLSPARVEAVILTHGHGDHTGGAELVRTTMSAPVHVHMADRALAGGRPPLKALAKSPLLARHVSREFLGAMRFFVGHGLLRPKGVKELSSFDDGQVLAVPGAPRVVHVPGHTAGSSALLLEARGVLVTGDALVTHDVYSGRRGPRLSARVSNADTDQARESLTALSPLRARVLLPGHGDPWQGSPAEAVAAAREAGVA
jgi:glyoxylase-like metal-dependent hydrolase (beta-lactamase superfamily II)